MAGETGAATGTATTSTPTLDMTNAIPIGGAIRTGITSGGGSAAPTSPVTDSSAMPSQDIVQRMAGVYGLDPDVVNRQIMQESNGNPAAVSKKGAIGLMQLMPDTAARLGVDPKDPIANLRGGMQEMSRLLTKYDGDYSKALAAYNAGESRVDKVNGVPDIAETNDYVRRILTGSKYESQLSLPAQAKDNNSANGNRLDMSTAIPIGSGSNSRLPPDDNPFPLSTATDRFAKSATEVGTGLPSDIHQVIPALRAMTVGPLDTAVKGKVNGIDIDIHNPFAQGGNVIFNIAKGMADANQSARAEAKDEWMKPGAGLSEKAAATTKYIIGSVPFLGPSITRSMTEAENGNYAGMLGSLTGMGLQWIMANPEASAARLDAAGKYLFSKPRVQETILAGEAKEMLDLAESKARARVRAMAPSVDGIPAIPAHQVNDLAQAALNEHITGITNTPRTIAAILDENPDKFKLAGAVDNGNGLIQLFQRLSSNSPVSMEDLHNYYSELGDSAYGKGRINGSVYNALKQVRKGIGELIDGNYRANPFSPADIDPLTGRPKPGVLPRSSQWEDFKSAWADMHEHWWDSDSPLYQARNAADPTARLQALVGDHAERARQYLSNYTQDGANPNAISAAQRFYKGLSQFQLRGLLQSSGGLVLSYMLRSAGMASNEAIYAAMTAIGARLGVGWFRTRPSLINLLGEAAERSSLGRTLPYNNPSPSASPSLSPSLLPSGSGGSGSGSAEPSPAPEPSIVEQSPLVQQAAGRSSTNAELEGMSTKTLRSVMEIMQKKGIAFSEAKAEFDKDSRGAAAVNKPVAEINAGDLRAMSDDQVRAKLAEIDARKAAANAPIPAPIKPVETDHSQSIASPADIGFLNSIKGNPHLNIDLNADISAATDMFNKLGDVPNLEKVPIDHLMKVMDLMTKSGATFAEADRMAKGEKPSIQVGSIPESEGITIDRDKLEDAIQSKGQDGVFASHRAKELADILANPQNYHDSQVAQAKSAVSMYMGPERRNFATRPKSKPGL